MEENIEIELVKIDTKGFKKELYKDYVKLFPAIERKSFHSLKRTYKKGFTSFIKILANNTTVGFFIVNTIKNNMQIDYFAILKIYQSHGYGSIAVKELQAQYRDYAMFLEFEKLGLGKDDAENSLRERRYNFYKKLGFEPLDFDVDLFSVIYTPCAFNFKQKTDKEFSIKSLFDFYYLTASKRFIDKHCRVIE